MEKEENLEQLCKSISNEILDSKILIEILDELLDGEKKKYTILKIIEKNLNTAFEHIETCRKFISVSNLKTSGSSPDVFYEL